MMKVVFPGGDLSELAKRFRSVSLESFAFAKARPVRMRKSWRLLVVSIHEAAPEDYEERTIFNVRPTAAFRLRMEKQARQDGMVLIYIHSHPMQAGIPAFSPTDDATEAALAPYARARLGKGPHVSLLIGAQGVAARVMADPAPVAVFEVGRHVLSYIPGAALVVGEEHDRQIRAFGEAGQRAIAALTVAIVGLGGTGSVMAQMLAHMGVRKFVLIDPKCLTKTSLNRVAGARPGDVGRAKVKVARRMIKSIAPNAEVTIRQDDVLEASVGAMVLATDFVLCCTDSHGSRSFLNQVAYQCYIPVIDMGVVIHVEDERITHFGGRVQMLAPGLGCLVCRDGILSADEVRRDLSNAEARAADPYFNTRVQVEQPAVMSLNSAVVAQAGTMFLAAVAGIPGEARSQILRGIQGDTRRLDDSPRAGCVNCSKDGYFGQGDKYDLPKRIS